MNINFLRDKDFAVSDEHKNIMKELELKTTEATEASNKSETEVGRREKIWGQIKTGMQDLLLCAPYHPRTTKQSHHVELTVCVF